MEEKDEEEIILNLKDNQNQRKNNLKNHYKNYFLWTHKKGLEGKDISIEIDKNHISESQYYSLLFDRDKKPFEMNKEYIRKLESNKRRFIYQAAIPKQTECLLNNIYNNIYTIKKKSQGLHKLNTIALQRISKERLKVFRPQTSIPSIDYKTKALLSPKPKKSKKKKKNKTTNKEEIIEYINDADDNKKSIKSMPFFSKTMSLKKINNISKSNFALNNKKEDKFNNKRSNTNHKKGLSAGEDEYNIKSIKMKNPMITFFKKKNQERIKNLLELDIPSLYTPKNQKNINLNRLTNIFRIQISKSFQTYNPINHLKDLNKMQRDSIQIRRQMEEIKQRVNQKITDLCTGRFYKKEYKKLKSMLDNNYGQSFNDYTIPDKIPFNIKLEINEKNRFNNIKNNNKSVVLFQNSYKIRALYEYLAKREKKTKKKINDDELDPNELIEKGFRKDFEQIEDTLENLYNSLEIKPITEYIDTYQNEEIKKDKNKLKEREKKYFPTFKEVDKYLNKIGNEYICKSKLNKKEVEEKLVILENRLKTLVGKED